MGGGGGGGGGGGEVSGERDLLYWSNKTVARLELSSVSAVAQHSPGTLGHCQPLSATAGLLGKYNRN